MIIKNFELERLKSTRIKKILFYGENEGYKNQIINNFFIKKFSDNFEKYEENQILNNYEDFFSSILNKSFFVKDKLIIIKCGEFDKYGRLLINIYEVTESNEYHMLGGTDTNRENTIDLDNPIRLDNSINNQLIDNKLAYAYTGATKQKFVDWCDKTISNELLD